MASQKPYTDVLNKLIKDHEKITTEQWSQIRTILKEGRIQKTEPFPKAAYSDDKDFDSAEMEGLPLRLQALTAHDYFDCFNNVIEQQMFIQRPNWARWMTRWLNNIKSE